jgi:hypothetical protein
MIIYSKIMTDIAYTLEDCLEILAGYKNTASEFYINSNDSILSSIARQVYRGTALTDRQYKLVKQKILEYDTQFCNNGFYQLEAAVDNLRKPLREIDRSKTVSLVTKDTMYDHVNVERNPKELWIKVRFPFAKKTIHLVEKIAEKNRKNYYHKKGTHSHFFRLTETLAYEIVSEFADRNFTIDQDLVAYYDKLKQISNAPEQYVPGIYNLEICNLHPNAVSALEKMHGKLDKNNLVKYRDSAMLFGIAHFDEKDLNSQLKRHSILAAKIATRETQNAHIKPSEYNLDSVALAIHELNRFPLVVLVEESDAYTQLSNSWQVFKNYVSKDQASVLFRLDNKDEKSKEFNAYVKNNKLNSPVDNNSKIVYINRNKLPKPILKHQWRPRTVLMLNSLRTKTNVSDWISECDLTLHYDEQPSVWRRSHSSLSSSKTKEIVTL